MSLVEHGNSRTTGSNIKLKQMKFVNTKLYDGIGAEYMVTRKADPYICDRLTHYLLPEKKSFYLDIGCGTGNYTIELNDRDLKFYGVDPSDAMLHEAAFKSQKIKWIQGTAQSIPVERQLFAGAIAILTIHHWLDFPASFAEINRVLKMNSKFVIFTALTEQMENYWLLHYFPEMMRLSIKQMPSLNLIMQAIRHTGFKLVATERYFIKDDLKDMFLYAGKNHPAIYLDEDIRRGIPSFFRLADSIELREGLRHLAMDLGSGRFSTIRKKYNDESGDYMFLVLEKVR